MSTPEVDAGGFQRTLKDLFAGAAGGIAQVLLGQWHECRSLIRCLGVSAQACLEHCGNGQNITYVLYLRIHLLALDIFLDIREISRVI